MKTVFYYNAEIISTVNVIYAALRGDEISIDGTTFTVTFRYRDVIKNGEITRSYDLTIPKT